MNAGLKTALSVLGWIGLGFVCWAVLVLGAIIWTGRMEDPMLIVTFALSVVVVWLGATGRLAWVFRKVG